jgi:hypothetical protein
MLQVWVRPSLHTHGLDLYGKPLGPSSDPPVVPGYQRLTEASVNGAQGP